MNFLSQRFASTGFWVTVVGIAALGPLAATVVTTLRHATVDSAPPARMLRVASSQPIAARHTARDTAPAPLGPGSGLTPTFATLPVPEVHLDESLPTVAPNDTSGNAFAMPDGRVCVLEMEEFRLRSLASNDSGATFTAEVDIAGGGGSPPVRSYSARLSGDGRVMVAYILADSSGDLGLRFVRSDDMCLSWTAPLTLVQAGDPTHGVRDVVLETGPSGHVSVLYRGDRGWDPYVVSSSDFGVNWTIPVRVDTGVPARTARVEGLDLALDASGRVYVAFTQDRFGNGASVWTATSFDGGQTFEPEQNFDPMLPAHGRSERPDLRVASDGSLLLAFWDNGGPFSTGDQLYCLRSIDQGLSFGVTLAVSLPSNSEKSFPLVLATAPGTQTVFLFTASDNNELSVYRSTNNGALFLLPATTLATASSGSSDESRPFTRIAWTRAGSSWVVGWSDQAADTYAGLRTDVYLRLTTNEGGSWIPQRRADSDPAGTSTSSMESVVATGTGSIFVLFRDGRPNGDRSFDVWATRSSVPLMAPVAEYRIDTDLAPVSPRVLEGVAVATDGESHIFSAYPVVDSGPLSSIRFSSSLYCCVTFVASTMDFGDDLQINTGPSIAATPDGFVYLAWTSFAPGGQAEVRFNRGVADAVLPTVTAWFPQDMVLGGYPHEATLGESSTRVVRVQALSGGEAYVLWTSDDHVFLSKWEEATQLVSTQIVDQALDQGNNSARFCVGVERGLGNVTRTAIVLGFLAPSLSGTGNTVMATMSHDGGQTWEPRVALKPESLQGNVRQLEMSCASDPDVATATAAIAYWTDDLGGPGDSIFSSVRRVNSWEGPIAVTLTLATDLRMGSPSGICCPGTPTADLAFADSLGRVFVSRSLDGVVSGTAAFRRLDEGAPDPDALSSSPVAVIDGDGNSWVAWLDESAGLSEVAVTRLISDGPAAVTVAAIFRASTAEPQGSLLRDWDASSARVAVAATGTAAIAWRAQAASSMADAVMTLYDINDLDRDGASVADDCNDGDASVRHVPSVVTYVTVAAVSLGPLRVPKLSWESQSESAGSSTTYEIVSGSLSDLRSTGTYGGATCLARGIVAPPYSDIRTGPLSGNAFYYLLRAVNSCGFGSFGDSSRLPDPRDQLDVPGICP